MKKFHFNMNIIMVSYIIGKKQLICKLFFLVPLAKMLR